MKRKRARPTPATKNASARSANGSKAPAPAKELFVVGIGASAGGLEATSALLTHTPPEMPMAFVVVMHLDPTQPSLLPDLLAKRTPMPVTAVRDHLRLEPSHVYIIPPGVLIAADDGQLRIEAPSKERGARMAVDHLFRSLAEVHGDRAIGVILSGTGTDGTAGIRAIKSRGGCVVIQDPASAQFAGMPRSAVETGLADAVIPVESIGPLLARLGQRGAAASPAAAAASSIDLNPILALLRVRSGFDFRHYKPTTLTRRIQRRMGLRQIEANDEYVRLLRENADEIDQLSRDLLIGVTSFFRDAESFAALDEEVIVPLVRDRSLNESIRVWVPGCATGEELYSIGMMFLDRIRASQKPIPLQMLATDIDESALDVARTGSYAESSVLAGVSADRIERYFRKDESGNLVVSDELRKRVVFAKHNLLADAPFSKIDLLSCRNLLIYLQPETQRALLSVFHFSLKPNGVLFLGTSETPTARDDLFESADSSHRLFRRRPGASRRTHLDFPIPPNLGIAREVALRPAPAPNVSDVVRQLLLEDDERVGVLVDRDDRVLYIHGDVSRFLSYPSGEPPFNLLDMPRDELRLRLRGALYQARNEKRAVEIPGIPIRGKDGAPSVASVQVKPVTTSRLPEASLMVTFREFAQDEPGAHAVSAETKTHDQWLRQLEDELRVTKDELRNTIEQLTGANEEMKAANEEAMSANEEFQSTNEELETAKEELQSLNEEITAVNAQLRDKVTELESLTNDLQNLFISTDVAALFLDTELRVRRYTPALTELVHLIPSDVGRPIRDMSGTIIDEALLEEAKRVIEKLVPTIAEIQTSSGQWYVRRVLPYRTRESRIDGVVITLTSIDAQKRAQRMLDEVKRYTESVLDTVRGPALLLEPSLRIQVANRAFYVAFAMRPEDCRGRCFFEIGGGAWDDPRLRASLERVVSEGARVENYEIESRDGDEGHSLRLNAARVASDGTEAANVLVSIEDVSEAKRSRDRWEALASRLAEENLRKDEFLAVLSHELRNPLAAISGGVRLLDRVTSDAEAEWTKNMIQEHASQLGRLLDDLLDVHRITRGTIELRRSVFELSAVLTRALESARPAVEAREHAITVAVPPGPIYLDGDAARVEQIFTNLLTNAAKYTNKGGNIALSVEVHGDSVDVTVRDDGIGIPPDKLAVIFEPFTQVRSSKLAQSGLGIGLSIVRKLAELHGGSVAVRSDGPGKGSAFTVTLPTTNRIPSRATEGASRATKLRPGLRVLIVDDNEDAARAIDILLKKAGCEDRVVHSGKEALEAAKAFKPEVVLLDIGLPDMSGVDVAKALRRRPELAKSLFIATTGFGHEKAKKEVLGAGFDYHMLKPVDFDFLITLLSRREPS